MKSRVFIDVEAKSKKWNDTKNIEKFIKKTCVSLIKLTEIKFFLEKQSRLEISISLVSDAQIKKINYKFRNKNKATDVLSFPFLDADLIKKYGFKKLVKPLKHLFLGDIIISFDSVKKDATLLKKSFHNHLSHLILHSILHLIGYDHIEPKDAKIMEEKEIGILKKIGIQNPYEPYK
jgi:probable rRNA maturation factor